ncbi:hypothetical protein P4U43_14230 [Arthrobacter sp. EH-1B-1]|uniref:Uncharacterized protein n=1 Tax=Arthrobacter vasquezii TaxID=2977629 RepID=A0ABT6CXX0_9MICC|nr:hypothetical protein [Arthrobacter vasquezii]
MVAPSKFGPPKLFIRTRMPHHQERAHEACQDRREGIPLKEHHRAYPGSSRQTAKEEERRIGRRQLDDRRPRCLIRELRGHGGGRGKAE